jgi:hypothetical protein
MKNARVMRFFTFRVLLIVIVAASGQPAWGEEMPKVLHRSDFSSGLSGFRELFRYYGRCELSIAGDAADATGDRVLRADFPEKTRALVGFTLAVRPAQRFRVLLSSRAELSRGNGFDVVVKCQGTNSHATSWTTLGRLAVTGSFADFDSDPFEVPPLANRAQIFIHANDVIGTLWLADVCVEPITLPPEVDKELRIRGPVRWGVCDALALSYSEADPTLSDTCAKLMALAGAENARMSCWWGSREQLVNDINAGRAWVCVDRDGTDRYDFSELAARIERLTHYDLRIEPLVVHGTPLWAGAGGEQVRTESDWRRRRRPFFKPVDWAEYETFVFELVSRFRDRIRVWEVMNEPNTPDSGLQGGHEVYRKYLRVFHRAAKRADPNCTVLCGRVGLDWLKAMVRDDPNILRSFDGIAMHPYTANGSGSFAQARREQLWLAARGTPKPVHITEVGFFGGVWHDPRPGAEVTREMGEKVAKGLPLMARVSGNVTWWNSCFASYAHGLLRREGHCLRPLDQYRAFGKVTGHLVDGIAPVTAYVEATARLLQPREQVLVTLRAKNQSNQPQHILFWPVGFVKGLGCDLEGIRNHEWAGVLQPGQTHEATIPVIPARDTGERSFPLGLGVVCAGGNTLELIELGRVAPTETRKLRKERILEDESNDEQVLP